MSDQHGSQVVRAHDALELPAVAAHLDAAITRHPALETIRSDIESAFVLLHDTVTPDGTIYLCGNGGSASDAEHFTAELMKGFELVRPLTDDERAGISPAIADTLQRGIRAVPLTGFVSLRTAVANDLDAIVEFAQPLSVLGRSGDALIAISTSGNSKNIVAVAEVAKARGMAVLALTGTGGGELSRYADVLVAAPVSRTLEVQELHLPIYHTLSLMLEGALFG